MAWYDYLTPIGAGNALAAKAGLPSVGNGSLFGGIKSALSPSQADTQPLQRAQTNSLGLQNQFKELAGAFGGQYLPQSDAALASNAAGQNANIQQLQKIAAGSTPSPTEMMLRRSGAANSANAYATAAALGARTPGAGLDTALRQAQTANSTADQQAAVQRAADQNAAQNQLTQALGQQQQGVTAQRGQTLGTVQDMYGNQLGAGGQVAGAAGAQVNANSNNANTKNSFYGGLISGGGQALAMASDRREKTDVTPVSGGSFDKLAEVLKGFGFEYKHPGEVPGEAPGARVGVMAQDAQKGGPAGQAMVKQGGDGVLRLDTGNALGVALAMSAEALRRSKSGARKAA